MKGERLSKELDRIKQELSTLEFKELQQMQEVQSQSHCRPMSGDITLCAVLCDGMSCGNFEHGGGGPFCAALIKCKGFTGDGGKCKAFEIVQPSGVTF